MALTSETPVGAPPGTQERLRRVLDRSGDTFLWLGNIEVEQVWGRGAMALPRLASADGLAIVSRMDEFALWAAQPTDAVVLKAEPDPGFLAYRTRLGFPTPTLRVLDSAASSHSVSIDLAERLANGSAPPLVGSAETRPRLMAHGFSVVEEEIARLWGIESAGPSAACCRQVNGKVYSRRLADAAGVHQPPGVTCTDVDEWSAAMDWARQRIGRRPVVIKEAFGVSGKGLTVVDSMERLERVGRMVEREARRSEGQVEFCVESWVDKRCDLNYQFTVSRSGEVQFDVVKEALTHNGAHRGHLFPARLTSDQQQLIGATADTVGTRLAADGYFGVVGVDALIDTDDVLYPMIEINARLNMASYQEPVREGAVAVDAAVLARHYDLRLSCPLDFEQIERSLGALLVTRPGQHGLIVLNHATVNAAFASGEGDDVRPGRLYVLLSGRDRAHLRTMDAKVESALADLTAIDRQGAA